MTLIGEPDRFAIEYELDAEKAADPSLAPWLYGKIRWWCGGEQIGIYEDDTTIRDVMSESLRFLQYTGTRTDPHLNQAPASEVVETISAALFEDVGQSDDQLRLDDERYRRYLVNPLVDAFDDWTVILVDGDRQSRLIWFHAQTPTGIHEHPIPPGEFDQIQQQFVDTLQNLEPT